MTKNGRSAKRAMTYSEEKAAARGEEVEENDAMNPIYTIPTQWEELYFKPVEVIQINAPGAKEHIQALRFAGTPFILEGFKGWMKFSADWVRPSGELDTAAFLRGIHDVKVPVIERKYEESNPIKTHLSLAYYVKNYWEKGSPEYYMHQWQFPLCPKGFKALCYKCDELPVVGDNLLLYWLDAVRGTWIDSRYCSYVLRVAHALLLLQQAITHFNIYLWVNRAQTAECIRIQAVWTSRSLQLSVRSA